MAQVVMVVHGMGNDAGAPSASDRTSWVSEIAAALRSAAASYKVAPDKLIVEPILYDDVFQRYALTWEKLAKSLEQTPLANVTSFMRNASDGSFLWGSIGDVVQYRAMPLVRQNVLTAVAAQIASAVAKHGTTHSYSVLAHSLGTAVAHDAITALAKRDVVGSTVMQPPNFRFANFFAIANVSRLVWATTDDFYSGSSVRPFGCGLPHEKCTLHHYASFRHVADPVASIVRFAPRSWSPARFQDVTVRHFREVNVHSFVHYLQSPQVTDRIVGRLFQLNVTPMARQARFDAFPNYVDALAPVKEAAVSSVEQLLDRVNGSAKGRLELDIGEITKALWQSRSRLSG